MRNRLEDEIFFATTRDSREQESPARKFPKAQRPAISIAAALSRVLPSWRVSGRPNKCDLEFAFAGHGLLGAAVKEKKRRKREEAERGILLATG